MNNFYNQPLFPQYQPQLQKMDIIHVTGEPGARALQMGPSSSALLLDDTAPIVWLVQTDGAGYKTIKPFTISAYEPEPAPDYKNIMDRIKRLEERINDKPDHEFTKSKQNRTNNGAQEKP